MTTYNEPARALEFLVSEANGQRSRDQVTIAAAAGALVPGAVLGRITASGKYVAYANGAADGSEVAAGILCYEAPDLAVDQLATIINGDAEVQGSLLNWGAASAPDITAGTADLLARNIKIRA